MYKGREVNLSGWHKLKFSGRTDALSAVEDYKKIHGVIDAQPVSIHTVYRIPSDEFYGEQWHLPKIGAPDAWDVETGNSNITVAVLDTGVRYFHGDLGGANASYSSPTNVDGNMWINWFEKNGTNGVDDDDNGKIDDWIGWDFVETTPAMDFLVYCYPGEDCNSVDNDPRYFNGHGTHCAGSVAAMNDNGVAACRRWQQ
jgi:subtilisin family serine protease